MNRKLIVVALTVCLLSSCYQESRLPVNADFETTVESDKYTAPAIVELTNNSTGADFYKWTFEGGTPSTSKDKKPGKITYSQAGDYEIVLEAWNDYERGEKKFPFTVYPNTPVSFNAKILTNTFAPAMVKITNTTLKEVSSFSWTFEGGIPATSTDRNPADVLFKEPGEHTISLVAKYKNKEFNSFQKIQLNPMVVDFDIEASFDDFDYEVPFTANLVNKITSGLTYEWLSTEGGEITDGDSENASIHIDTQGTYTVTLKVDNGKEPKTTTSKEVTVTVYENSNLYKMVDVKFGIKSAASIVGSFYSLKNREIVTPNNVTDSNGKDINLVFFGINPSFVDCYFTSPDHASAFDIIPNATKTYFVNTIETSGLSFTDGDFDTMTDDSLLKPLDIKSASNTTSTFTNMQIPRIVLFETADGRKGAIKIKAFVSEQINSSYILTDIKFQKEKAK
jgi:hypothetical protein